MKLLLTSAGFRKDNRSEWRKEIVDGFKKLLGKDPKGLKCAFIPTAADPEENKWFVDTARAEILDLGMELVEVDLKDPNQSAIKEKLEQAKVIYVNGGNTFYLLDWIRKSGLRVYLKDLLEKRKVYVGVSAGSVIVGPDIEISGWGPTGDPNVINLEDTTGLNFISFAISPHFTESERIILQQKVGEVGYPVIALTDEQAMFIDGENQVLLGEGEKITFE